MKKVFLTIIVSIIMIGLSACDTENINAPSFSSVQLAYSEYSEIDDLFHNQTLLSSDRRRVNTPLESVSGTTTSDGEYIGDTYITYVGNKEYLIIEINQPDLVEDFYVIDSVTVRSNLWNNNIKFIRGSGFQENELKQKHDYVTATTYVYIPIIINNKIGSVGKYEITAIQYLDGNSLNDVRFPSGVQTSLSLHIGNRDIQVNQALYSDEAGYYQSSLSNDKSSITLNFSNPDNANVTEIHINDVLIYSGEHAFQQLNDETPIPISSNINVESNWVKLKIIYEKAIINDIKYYEELILFAVDSSQYPFISGLAVSTQQDLNIIMNDYYPVHVINLMNNLILSEDFQFKNFHNIYLISADVKKIIEITTPIDYTISFDEGAFMSFCNVVFANDVYITSNVRGMGFQFMYERYNAITEQYILEITHKYGVYEDNVFIEDIEQREIYINRIRVK